MTEIGYQHGVKAAMNRLRKLDPGGTNAQGTGAWDKLERTLLILVADHDAAIVDPEPPPPPPPPPDPPPGPRLAPMTHYKAGGADARYCVQSPGVTKVGPDDYRDEGGYTYSENGLCKSGGRSGQFIAELKGADSLDGLEPCSGYTKDGRTFPPWPAASYEV